MLVGNLSKETVGLEKRNVFFMEDFSESFFG